MFSHPVKLRPLKTTVFVVVALTFGLQWVALQMVAWTGMTYMSALTMPFTVAIEKTVSGGQACGLCLFIQENQINDRGENTVILKPLSSTDIVFSIKENLLNPPPVLSCLVHDIITVHRGNIEAPPRPPPEFKV